MLYKFYIIMYQPRLELIMAKTASSMIALGTVAPDFNLPEPATGKTRDLQSMRGARGTMIMFICNHCPFVKFVAHELARLGQDYMPRDIAVVAINANDVIAYPDDAPDKMVVEARQQGYTFPYLYDQSQQVAKAYQAACTPDFYLYDADLKCVYRGQLDDARPSNGIAVTGRDLRAAIEALLSGEAVAHEQRPSIGCGIKWKTT